MLHFFEKNKISPSKMKAICGGISECTLCKQASFYDCQILGGYTPGTIGFDRCLREGYAGCNATACAQK
jgi:hypothetical protein